MFVLVSFWYEMGEGDSFLFFLITTSDWYATYNNSIHMCIQCKYVYRKGGVNRLIRIIQRDGLYGFAEPLEYRSVMELVAYYQANSLAPYSPKLDITLKTPVSKNDNLVTNTIVYIYMYVWTS